MTDPLRRACLDKLCPAERAIHDAMQAVEAMPADVRLTDAVILLDRARDRVADFVDGVPFTSTHDPRLMALRTVMALPEASSDQILVALQAVRGQLLRILESGGADPEELDKKSLYDLVRDLTLDLLCEYERAGDVDSPEELHETICRSLSHPAGCVIVGVTPMTSVRDLSVRIALGTRELLRAWMDEPTRADCNVALPPLGEATFTVWHVQGHTDPGGTRLDVPVRVTWK